MRRRRRLGALAAATAMALLASGCSAQEWGISSSASGKKTHLIYALWDPHEQIGYQQSINEFQKLHPNISVTIENIPYTSYQPKITAQYISGNAPDVFWVNTPFLGDWINDGMLENLAPLIHKAHINMSQYYPALVKLHEHKGAIYGLPKDWDTICFYYNMSYFKKHHIAIPKKLTWTPSGGGNFTHFLETLTTDKSGHNATQASFNPHHIATYSVALDNDLQQVIGNYFAENGGRVIPHPFSPRADLNSHANVATLHYLVDTLVKDHAVMPPSQTGSEAAGTNDLTLFAQGKTAMYEAGDWNTTSISQLTNFKIGVMELPIGPHGRVSVFNGLIDAIATNGQHKAAAWELERWLGSPASQRIMGSGGYVWPAIKSLDLLFVKYWKKHGINMQPFLTEAHGKTVNWPVSPGMGQALNDVTTWLGPVFIGSSPPRQGLDSAERIVNYDLSGA